MAQKNGKLQRIEEMKTMLRSGADRKDILAKLSISWKVSRATMDNELKIAREAVKGEIQARSTILQDRMTEELKTEINASIKSDLELDLILSQIASANITIEEYINGDAVTRGVSPFEQIAAIDKLYKRRGSYAPVKAAQTTRDGEDVNYKILSFDPLTLPDATNNNSAEENSGA